MSKNKEIHSFYRLGYETGFKSAILAMKEISLPPTEECKVFLQECVDKLINYYNKYPCIQEISIEEV